MCVCLYHNSHVIKNSAESHYCALMSFTGYVLLSALFHAPPASGKRNSHVLYEWL